MNEINEVNFNPLTGGIGAKGKLATPLCYAGITMAFAILAAKSKDPFAKVILFTGALIFLAYAAESADKLV